MSIPFSNFHFASGVRVTKLKFPELDTGRDRPYLLPSPQEPLWLILYHSSPNSTHYLRMNCNLLSSLDLTDPPQWPYPIVLFLPDPKVSLLFQLSRFQVWAKIYLVFESSQCGGKQNFRIGFPCCIYMLNDYLSLTAALSIYTLVELHIWLFEKQSLNGLFLTVAAQGSNPGTQAAEAGRSLWVSSRPARAAQKLCLIKPQAPQNICKNRNRIDSLE